MFSHPSFITALLLFLQDIFQLVFYRVTKILMLALKRFLVAFSIQRFKCNFFFHSTDVTDLLN